jgi:hypothetical protein
MHDRYEDWRTEAMRAEQAITRDGYTVIRVVIDPTNWPDGAHSVDWCQHRMSGHSM